MDVTSFDAWIATCFEMCLFFSFFAILGQGAETESDYI